MRFIAEGNAWRLVDDRGPDGPRTIATLRSELEALALKTFCEAYLDDPGSWPSNFNVQHAGKNHDVYFLAEKGERLTLYITHEDGTTSSVVTEFIL